jgi:hypothetical protein
MCHPMLDLDYYYAGTASGRISQHLAKITVQCDERSTFALAHFEKRLIRCATQPSAGDGGHIVAGGADQIGRASAEVFVEF